MAHPSASFSFTLRDRFENRPGTFADLAHAAEEDGVARRGSESAEVTATRPRGA
jgi:hypothetical protein